MQVSEADKAVEESNQNRSAMSSSMLQRLKKASADYEVSCEKVACCYSVSSAVDAHRQPGVLIARSSH